VKVISVSVKNVQEELSKNTQNWKKEARERVEQLTTAFKKKRRILQRTKDHTEFTE
jgi:hypothetical protein